MKTRTSPKSLRAPDAPRARKATPAAAEPVAAERFLINTVGWAQYEQMVELFGENRLFMTYADGELELRVPWQAHEQAKEMLSGLVAMYAFLSKIPMEPFGSTTLKSATAQVGLDPDKCFYFHHLDWIRSSKKLDFAVDPPPDLAIEIEVTSSRIPRLPIYRQLGIPELWRYDGKALTIEVLDKGEYVTSSRSLAFPQLTTKVLLQWMKVGEAKGYSAMLRAVEGWCAD